LRVDHYYAHQHVIQRCRPLHDPEVVMDEFDHELARFARDASRAQDVPNTAARIVAFARETVGTAYAGITLNQPRGRFASISATDPVVQEADRLQYELREGPCVTVSGATPIVSSADVGRDPRWPRWGPAATRLGLASVLSAQLRARGRRIGGLNLYGDTPRQFSGDDAALAHVFAVHAAVALAAALQEERLRTVLDNRTQIAQAQGMLMERFGLSADQAVATLRRYSQVTGTKLDQVAQTLVATRELPEAGQNDQDQFPSEQRDCPQ
jgi:GAF domain-containing protein